MEYEERPKYDIPAESWPHLNTPENKPIVCILIGMAGTGKTTFMQRLNAHIHEKKIPGYIINLDPAVANLPYTPNIDIRDSVKYKDVMKQYNLGPNGGILTSLNLFATRFDQVIEFVQKRAPGIKYVFVDTPGQIEVFNWSASGTIITEAFASKYPTIVTYIVDTPRCINPATFMSNMLYGCSMLYKTRLPLILAFNKIDIVRHEFALEWMQDNDVFEEAARQKEKYSSNLTQSMGTMLEAFYRHLNVVGVSAITGTGVDEFLLELRRGAVQWEQEYMPELQRLREEKVRREKERQQRDIERMKQDVAQEGNVRVKLDGHSPFNAMGQRVMLNMDDDDNTNPFEDDGVMHTSDHSYLDVVQPEDMDDDEVEAERAAMEEGLKLLGLGK